MAKDLRTPKYGQRRVEDKKKKYIDVRNLTHRELVELINEKSNLTVEDDKSDRDKLLDLYEEELKV